MTDRHPHRADRDERDDRGERREPPDSDDAESAQADAYSAGDDSPSSEVEQLRAELQNTRERLLRITAELENFRKRANREQETERRYAGLPVMRDLLPVLDNIQRAVDAAEKSHSTASLLEGFKLVAQQLNAMLKAHHCVRIDALGQPFDPQVHEAISQLPSTEYPPGTVMAVASTGYTLHDRVVRPSQVVVAAPDAG